MKVKDLKALLATYNQDAEVRVIAHCREYDFSLTMGGEGEDESEEHECGESAAEEAAAEGVTKGTTKEVGIYVDALCGHDNANDKVEFSERSEASERSAQVACHAQAINQLHTDAKTMEETGAKLLSESRLHDAHTRLDTARCLRVAANFLDGVSGT